MVVGGGKYHLDVVPRRGNFRADPQRSGCHLFDLPNAPAGRLKSDWCNVSQHPEPKAAGSRLRCVLSSRREIRHTTQIPAKKPGRGGNRGVAEYLPTPDFRDLWRHAHRRAERRPGDQHGWVHKE